MDTQARIDADLNRLRLLYRKIVEAHDHIARSQAMIAWSIDAIAFLDRLQGRQDSN